MLHPQRWNFDLKIHAVVVWGGESLYNLDEIEREMTFYKTMKKNSTFVLTCQQNLDF